MARLPESITVFVENIPKVADALQKAEWLRLAAEDVVLQRGRSREAGMAVTSAKAMDRLADALRAIEEPAAGVRVGDGAAIARIVEEQGLALGRLRAAAQAYLDAFGMPLTTDAEVHYDTLTAAREALRAALGDKP